MGTAYNTNVVTDGIKFYWDAANRRSYPGTGTSWDDMVKSKPASINNATFTNQRGGYIEFDGTNDDVTIANDADFTMPAGDWTICVWCQDLGGNADKRHIIGTYSSNPRWIIRDTDDGAAGWAFMTKSDSAGWNRTYSTVDIQDTDDEWHYLVVTGSSGGGSGSIKLYTDGVDTSLSSSYALESITRTTTTIYMGNAADSGHDLEGNIASVAIYNRVLTAAEVKQNYEATKPRFTPRIAKSNLELNFDAGDPQSYNGGTIWKDTASGISAELQNIDTGGFRSQNGGVIEFDGTDEFAIVAQSGGWSMQGWAALTMETWINVAGNRWHRILYENQNDASTYAYRVATDLYNANSAFWLLAGSSVAVQESIVSLDTWFQYVCRWDGTTMNVYKNGVKVGSGTSNSGTIESSSGSKGGVAIAGGWNSVNGLDDVNETFYGKMGLLRVYQGALSDAEIMDNYNKTKARFGH